MNRPLLGAIAPPLGVALIALIGGLDPAWLAGSLAALPITALACLVLSFAWSRGIGAALAGALVALLVRLIGVVSAWLMLTGVAGLPARPAVIVCMACVVAGLAVETTLRTQFSSVKEPACA